VTLEKPKTEKHAEKGPEKKRRSKTWRKREQEDGVWLGEHAGEDTDPTFSKIKSNLNRVGHIVSLGYDLTSERYVGEVKERSSLPSWLWQSWIQVNQAALGRKKDAVLFLHAKGAEKYFSFEGKKYLVPNPIHLLSQARHETLLRAEKERDALLLEIEELKRGWDAHRTDNNCA
jgi:hypothetical protein